MEREMEGEMKVDWKESRRGFERPKGVFDKGA